MWARIAKSYPVAYSPRPLACYRTLITGNITHQSYLSGQNVFDTIKVIDTIQTYLPPDIRRKLKAKDLSSCSIHCAKMANYLYSRNKNAAFLQAK